jgi:TetR/AcrR family transcriptional regulator
MPVKRDSEATRAALIDAAETVFLDKGFGGASLSAIAQRAGMTKSLIHHHFGSKEGLWREVKLRRFAHYAEQQMAMLNDAPPTVDLLRESMQLYFRFMEHNPQLVRILAWMFLERDHEECINIDRDLIQAGADKVRAAQKRGLLRADIDPRFILFVFIGLAQHWFQDREHFCHDFGTDDLPEDLNSAYLEAIEKIFFEGILPR